MKTVELKSNQRFDSGQYFFEGLSRVRDGGVGYLSPDGEWAIEPRFQNGREFREGSGGCRN